MGGVVSVAAAVACMVGMVAGMVGVTGLGRMAFVARVVGMAAVGRMGFVGGVVFVARVVAFGVVVHVVGVRVRLGRIAVVLVGFVTGVVVVRLVVVPVVRLGIGPGVAVRSVSGVVHVFPLDAESGIRIMVEAPAGGTRFAAIGPQRRSPIQSYPHRVFLKPLYTPYGYQRQAGATRPTPAGPRRQRGPAGTSG